ncbi:hypothetical protein BDM02DRAFT_3107645 [Thelephora ganbajun]|uniref:Uncharacterized protein n=1 Tax=Thelephora ganbajun TaxID=370292 RepID=A0ACB6ZVV8_THEGA|nr:hypothetical protein BDM02DRAFT_3107645 [Thelephora ganbajun]
MGEKITSYLRARSSETSPLVLFLYNVFWAKNCFPTGSFPEVEEGINSLLYDPPKRYDLTPQSIGGSGWHQPSFDQDRDANRSRDPRRPPSASVQDQNPRRGEGKVYLLDLRPAIESVCRYQDPKRNLYSAAQKFGIQVSEEERNPVHDSLLIIRLWTLVFSGSPKKIREEELESARKSAPAKPEFENELKSENTKGATPIQPDDEDVDPNDIPPGPSDANSSSSTFGKPQVAPEVDWENPFDEDEDDDD